MRIVRVGEREWEQVREIRLRALHEDADALGARVAREERFGPKHWQMRLRSSPTWLAWSADDAVGIVSMISEPASPVDDRHLVGLWVAPEARRTGIGWALVDTVRTAAAEEDARTLSLWVNDENEPAIDLFVRAGFERTGERQRSPRDDDRVEERYVYELQAPTSTGSSVDMS
ncbi:MAG: GNAT family N-acetyltransferase [Micrococcales bacterium]|nr:GNAT family N-acetyltransferase [Micrococcales bacterium]